MRRSVRRRVIVGSVISALLLGSAIGIATAGNFVEENGSDFDCDGIRDTVVTDSAAAVDGHSGAGSVAVTHSSTGTVATITQETDGVPGSAEDGDAFGLTHTSYDRNSDGCDDLVIGIPAEDIGSVENAGMITIIPGSAEGLDTSNSVGRTQNSSGFAGVPEADDSFGSRLAGGVTHTGQPFLLIATSGENRRAGSLYYMRSDVIAVITQNSPGVAGTGEPDDHFGWSLAASDRHFAVGSAIEAISDRTEAGMVHIFSHDITSGRPTPLRGITQNTSGVSGTAETSDRFGYSVSVMPYQRPGDSAPGTLVAVGSSRETVGSVRAAGMAHLLFVSSSGSLSQVAAVTQNTPGVTGGSETEDYLGHDIVLANLDPSTAVATPESAVWAVEVFGERTGSGESGAVHVFRPGWQRGDRDIWLEDGRFGLPPNSLSNISVLRASSSSLHVGSGSGQCHAVPWKNILAGGDHPATLRQDDCL